MNNWLPNQFTTGTDYDDSERHCEGGQQTEILPGQTHLLGDRGVAMVTGPSRCQLWRNLYWQQNGGILLNIILILLRDLEAQILLFTTPFCVTTQFFSRWFYMIKLVWGAQKDTSIL